MKTSDGYTIKTADLVSIAGKDPNDSDYPLASQISTVPSYTSVIDS